MKDVTVRIKGRVQGVGYRRFAVSKARDIGGISGWVYNDCDGSVLIRMKGEDTRIDEMLDACRKGPLWGKVEEIEFVVGRLSSFLSEVEIGVFKRV